MSDILEFLARQPELFTRVQHEYWDGYFSLPSDGSYLLVQFEEDETYHTYRYPPDWINP